MRAGWFPAAPPKPATGTQDGVFLPFTRSPPRAGRGLQSRHLFGGMTMVKRWRFHIGHGMCQDVDGAYVDWPDYQRIHTDYAALEAENARLLEQLRLCNIDQLTAEAENAALRARIEAAPHTEACNSHHHCGICSAHWGSVVHDGGHRAWRHKFVPGPCDCWKSAP